jgi:hypothetical protein
LRPLRGSQNESEICAPNSQVHIGKDEHRGKKSATLFPHGCPSKQGAKPLTASYWREAVAALAVNHAKISRMEVMTPTSPESDKEQ